MTGFQPAGFPHSEISGSRVVCTSPELFAAYHVLHRLHAPRHPPCALSSLTIISAHHKKSVSTAGSFSPSYSWRPPENTFPGILSRQSFFPKDTPVVLNLWDFAYSIIKEHCLLRKPPQAKLYKLCSGLAAFLPLSAFMPLSLGLSHQILVEVRGFEPLTPWLQTMCSAS